jgi:hypothetical protein
LYAHLIGPHVSVAVRLAGDLVEPLAQYRAWGGLLNAAVLLLFIANTISSAFSRAFAPSPSHRRRDIPDPARAQSPD